MNSNNQNFPEDASKSELSEGIEEKKITTPETSATTSDIPEFGWSYYAERMNGRFAMIGFFAILLIEAFSNDSFLHWAGFLP